MGYRSETAIAIENEAFRELLVKAKAECIDAFEFIKDASIYRTDILNAKKIYQRKLSGRIEKIERICRGNIR